MVSKGVHLPNKKCTQNCGTPGVPPCSRGCAHKGPVRQPRTYRFNDQIQPLESREKIATMTFNLIRAVCSEPLKSKTKTPKRFGVRPLHTLKLQLRFSRTQVVRVRKGKCQKPRSPFFPRSREGLEFFRYSLANSAPLKPEDNRRARVRPERKSLSL